MKMQKRMIGFDHIDGEHSGERIAKVLMRVINEYGLQSKILAMLKPLKYYTLQCSKSIKPAINEALLRYDCMDTHLRDCAANCGDALLSAALLAARAKVQQYYEMMAIIKTIAIILVPP